MSLKDLFKGISLASTGSKHNRPGWINVSCPYCGRGSHHHLGFNIRNQYFSCFQCGKKPLLKTFVKITGLPPNEILTLLKQAKKGGKSGIYSLDDEVNKKPFEVPSNMIHIGKSKAYKAYLKRRGLNWKNLVREYNILGTSLTSKLDNIDFSWRIYIPITYLGEVVTWQTRAIGKVSIPYLACPEQYEKVNIKDMLYPEESSHTVFLTEGLFDCWKVRAAGYPAICGFGVGLKAKQIKRLAGKRVIIFYDGDNAGNIEREKIKDRIEFITGNEVFIADCPIDKDPGSLSLNQIDKILRRFK